MTADGSAAGMAGLPWGTRGDLLRALPPAGVIVPAASVQHSRRERGTPLVVVALGQQPDVLDRTVEVLQVLGTEQGFDPVFVLDRPDFAVLRRREARFDFVMPRPAWESLHPWVPYGDYVTDRLRAVLRVWGAAGLLPLPTTGVRDLPAAALAVLGAPITAQRGPSA